MGGRQWLRRGALFPHLQSHLQTQKFPILNSHTSEVGTQLNEFSYPKPIVEHELARKRCLEVYSKALKRSYGGLTRLMYREESSSNK